MVLIVPFRFHHSGFCRNPGMRRSMHYHMEIFKKVDVIDSDNWEGFDVRNTMGVDIWTSELPAKVHVIGDVVHAGCRSTNTFFIGLPYHNAYFYQQRGYFWRIRIQWSYTSYRGHKSANFLSILLCVACLSICGGHLLLLYKSIDNSLINSNYSSHNNNLAVHLGERVKTPKRNSKR
nr:hypothetical protein [Tanacetum cinerariifolium]